VITLEKQSELGRIAPFDEFHQRPVSLRFQSPSPWNTEATAKGYKEILWAGSKGGAGFSLSSASAVEATAKGSKEILTKPKLKRPITKIRYPGDLIYAFILPLSTLARSHQRFTSYFSNSGAIPITRAHFRRSFR
jgi:hypothetical protein